MSIIESFSSKTISVYGEINTSPRQMRVLLYYLMYSGVPVSYTLMSSNTAVADTLVSQEFNSLRQIVDEEISQTGEERDALRSFRDRLAEIVDLSPHGTTGPFGATATDSNDGLCIRSQVATSNTATDTISAVRTAYQETFMSLPFYEEEYDELYVESLSAEFGEDIAIALTRAECFTPAVRSSLFEQIDVALEERERGLDICHEERNSIEMAHEELAPIVEEHESIARVAFDQQSYEQLQYYRDRCLRQQERCDAVARRRQKVLNRRREQYDFGGENSTFCIYLYRDLESAHPILSVCSSVATHVTETREQIERALTYYN